MSDHDKYPSGPFGGAGLDDNAEANIVAVGMEIQEDRERMASATQDLEAFKTVEETGVTREQVAFAANSGLIMAENFKKAAGKGSQFPRETFVRRGVDYAMGTMSRYYPDGVTSQVYSNLEKVFKSVISDKLSK